MKKRLLLHCLLIFIMCTTYAHAKVIHQTLQPAKAIGQMQSEQVVIDGTTFNIDYDWGLGGLGIFEVGYNSLQIMVDSWDLITLFSAGDTLTPSHTLNVDGFSWTTGPQDETTGINYIGVKTLNNNYAWIKLEYRNVGNDWFVDVLEYAYEDNGGAIIAGSTTSISNNVGIHELKPTPFVFTLNSIQKEVTIEAQESNYKVEIFDFAGRNVHQSVSSDVISVAHLKSGYYVISIYSEASALQEKLYIP